LFTKDIGVLQDHGSWQTIGAKCVSSTLQPIVNMFSWSFNCLHWRYSYHGRIAVCHVWLVL